jgi:hypothetical protein
MSFAPRAVFLIGPDSGYNSIDGHYNESYLCIPWVDHDLSTENIGYVDCSGGETWPDAIFGNRRGLGKLYPWPAHLDNPHIQLLAENRVVSIESNEPNQLFEVWSMVGDIPAGCEPISSTTFTSPNWAFTLNQGESFCGVETGDYRAIRDEFHQSDHKSYIDFYRIHDGVESERVGIRSYFYDSMRTPVFETSFLGIRDFYTFTFRSQHVLQAGEQAKYICEVSTSPTFVAGTITSSEGYMSLVYDYHEASISWWVPASGTWYIRFKRHDELIADPTLFTDSGWSNTITVNPRERTDETPLNGSPAWIPYYCYQDYDATYEKQHWAVYAYGDGADQEADIVRIQTSTSEDFATVLHEDIISYFYSVRGTSYVLSEFVHGYGFGYIWDNDGTVYYARCRNENTDGSVVGPWSNVFSMDGGNDGANHVDRINEAEPHNPPNDGIVRVPETHWLGEQTTYHVESESIYEAGHTYVLLSKQRNVYDTQSVICDHFFGSSWLADYDGSTVTLSVIDAEVESAWFLNQFNRCDIVKFGGKIYAGWMTPSIRSDANNMYEWCEITGGVVGTISHIPLPAEIDPTLGSADWVTMAVIHGDLRVVASLHTGNSGVN